MVVFRREIGDVLRDARQRQGRTLREVSSAARVSLGYLSEVERGQKEASSELLNSICEALDVPMSLVLREVSDRVAVAEGLLIPDTVPADLAASVGRCLRLSVGAVAVGARRHRLIGWPRPSTHDRTDSSVPVDGSLPSARDDGQRCPVVLLHGPWTSVRGPLLLCGAAVPSRSRGLGDRRDLRGTRAVSAAHGLAARAVEDRPLHRGLAGLADRDRGTAAVARLARPGVSVIWWPAAGHGPYLAAGRGEQPGRVGDRVGRSPRPELFRQQRLGREHRADPGDDPLVEQHLRHRCRPARRPPAQGLVRVDGLAEEVRPEVADEGVLVPVRTTSSIPRWCPTAVHRRWPARPARSSRAPPPAASRPGDAPAPSIRRCVCSVRPSSNRVSRCFP